MVCSRLAVKSVFLFNFSLSLSFFFYLCAASRKRRLVMVIWRDLTRESRYSNDDQTFSHRLFCFGVGFLKRLAFVAESSRAVISEGILTTWNSSISPRGLFRLKSCISWLKIVPASKALDEVLLKAFFREDESWMEDLKPQISHLAMNWFYVNHEASLYSSTSLQH